ncbi:trafficking protein particle complex subunit 4 [Anaeramoeba ignava]|uniref:Trafficking protein particle complex subunit n=1 Tax=Anaeramoeba ignava TaxID=1746090 RepID=A0A9Q0RCQ3_ANAIG|nr:trafficking protein particle complex subunit 4 [Anaeramoeba ignava]
MVVYSLYIINKSGGVIYTYFNQKASPQTKSNANANLSIGSVFHSLFTMATTISPVQNSSGIQVLEANNFTLHCLLTVTGTKFFVITDPSHPDPQALLQQIYELYCDDILKNPFYDLEQPIYRHDKTFVLKLQEMIEK